MTGQWEVIQGDCLDLMAGMAPNSVDSIVTDPPYGLRFMGKGWDHSVPGAPFWGAALRVAKPGAHLVAFGGTRTFHRLTCAIEDAGWEIRDCLSWLYGSGFPKSHNGPWGGTALKPGWEPIILARKPLIGTVAANVAEHRTGGMNIDACRIDGVSKGGSGSPPLRFGGMNARPSHEEYDRRRREGEPSAARRYTATGGTDLSMMPGVRDGNPLGRWPANVALDEEAAIALDLQTGTLTSGANPERRTSPKTRDIFGAFVGTETCIAHRGADAGGASRFFYCAKPSRTERNAGLTSSSTPVVGAGALPCETEDADWKARNGNHHPTVKPVALMRWLCRLVTPAGGLVLDPFTGSGSTGCAAVEEGCRFIGAELNSEYSEIARRRIMAAVALPTAEREVA